jgi:hypothetical protein
MTRASMLAYLRTGHSALDVCIRKYRELPAKLERKMRGSIPINALYVVPDAHTLGSGTCALCHVHLLRMGEVPVRYRNKFDPTCGSCPLNTRKLQCDTHGSPYANIKNQISIGAIPVANLLEFVQACNAMVHILERKRRDGNAKSVGFD